jgi:hypothetical protein
MSCDITAGRIEPCKDAVGGINNIYIFNYDTLPVSGVTYDATDTDVIDVLGTALTAYKYELKATTNTLEQTINASRDNGTTFFETALNITLKKMTKEANKELKLLCYGRPKILVEDNQGNLLLCGLDHGCDVTGGTFSTGGGMADLNGYTLTFSAMEKIPANFCVAATGTAPDIPAQLLALGITTIVTS